MKQKVMCLLLVFTMAFSLVACGERDGANENNPEGIDAKWLDEDGKVHVNVAVTQALDSLDYSDCNNGQAWQNLNPLIYTPLIGTDRAGHYGEEYGVGVAERWDVNDTGTEWTFYLKKGITFNNGEVCDADDVVCTLNRYMTFQGQKSRTGDIWNYLYKVEKIDQYTVKAYFSETYGTPYEWFCEAFIISDTDYAELGEDYFYKGYLYGTGAWEFVEYIDGQSYTIARRDDYWGENNSNIDLITTYIMTEENAIVNGLLSGAIDFTPRLSSDLLALLDDDPDVSWGSGNTYGSYAMIGLQCGEQSAFHDVKLRQAFAWCIDRQTIADTLMGGGEALQQWIPKGSLGHSDDDLEPIYDPELAKQLVAESDYDGRDITLHVSVALTNGQNIGLAVCDYAKAVGINMHVEMGEQAYLLELRAQGAYDAYLVSNTDRGDEGAYTVTKLSNPGHGHNFKNERMSEICSLIPTTFKTEEREQLLAEANKILYDEAVFVSLFTLDYKYACREGLTDWVIPFTGYFYLDNARVA